MSNKQNISFTQGQWSADKIKAHGNIQTRLAVINAVSWICGLLAVGGMIYSCLYPDKTKDIWVIIGPIISGPLMGMIGYLAGERDPSNK